MQVLSYWGRRPQLQIYHTAGARRELRDQCIAARNGKPPWSTNAFLCTVSESEHHHVVSAGISLDEFSDRHPQPWMKGAYITSEDATEVYMVEVSAESDM